MPKKKKQKQKQEQQQNESAHVIVPVVQKQQQQKMRTRAYIKPETLFVEEKKKHACSICMCSVCDVHEALFERGGCNREGESKWAVTHSTHTHTTRRKVKNFKLVYSAQRVSARILDESTCVSCWSPTRLTLQCTVFDLNYNERTQPLHQINSAFSLSHTRIEIVIERKREGVSPLNERIWADNNNNNNWSHAHHSVK